MRHLGHWGSVSLQRGLGDMKSTLRNVISLIDLHFNCRLLRSYPKDHRKQRPGALSIVCPVYRFSSQ